MAIDIEVRGMEEMIRAMNRLPGLLHTVVIGDGLYAAAGVVAQHAKQTSAFTSRTGRLRRSIRRRRRSQRVFTRSGSRRTANAAARVHAGGKGARQAWIIEGGRKAGKSGGRNYPGADARPFLYPALSETQGAQLAAAIAEVRQSLPKIQSQLAAAGRGSLGSLNTRTRRLLGADT